MRTTCLLKASAILLPVGQWEGGGPFACDISSGKEVASKSTTISQLWFRHNLETMGKPTSLITLGKTTFAS